MLKHLLSSSNLNRAYLQVYRNKGSSGVDGMEVTNLTSHFKTRASRYKCQIANQTYKVSPILGIEIPKSKGKRLLGIPTVVDRVFQQALHQVLQPLFEPDFSKYSYGFRPRRNAHQAVKQGLLYINTSKRHIVDIDLRSFFDEVAHGLLLGLIYKKVKCPAILRLLRSYLKAPIEIGVFFAKVPRESLRVLP